MSAVDPVIPRIPCQGVGERVPDEALAGDGDGVRGAIDGDLDGLGGAAQAGDGKAVDDALSGSESLDGGVAVVEGD